jgi:hypothetical protein
VINLALFLVKHDIIVDKVGNAVPHRIIPTA